MTHQVVASRTTPVGTRRGRATQRRESSEKNVGSGDVGTLATDLFKVGDISRLAVGRHVDEGTCTGCRSLAHWVVRLRVPRPQLPQLRAGQTWRRVRRRLIRIR